MNIPYLSKQYIAARAKELSDSVSNEDSCSIDIEYLITKMLGLKLLMCDLKSTYGQRTLGAYLAEAYAILWDQTLEPKGENKRTKEHLLRFTLAHEVGHHVLHKEIMATPDNYKLLYTEDEKTNSRLELQANIFAANLLMPEESFIHEHSKIICQGLNNDYEISRCLSDLFNVSRQTVQFRIKNLEL